MKSCPDCGAKQLAHALFCGHCGAPLKRRGTSTLSGSPQRISRSDEQTISRLGAIDLDSAITIPESRPAFRMGRGARQDSSPGAEPPQLIPIEALESISGRGPCFERLLKEEQHSASLPAPEAQSPNTEQALLKQGQLFEGYQVEREIGCGGMGRVYLAQHEITRQQVAIKLLHPQYLREPRQKKRFINEAQLLAKMQHPNLVPLLGFLTTGRQIAIVMPYIPGSTLEEIIQERGPLPFTLAQRWFSQICNGICSVHSHNIRHRDIKSSNIIIRPDGRVIITDFGVSRALGAESLTLTGMVVGTAEYLAPEQATGSSREDLRSDIYSLGVLLYEMLTGRLPFRDPSPAQVLLKHVNSPPPPPRGIREEIPLAVQHVILQALRKQPEDRYESVEDFQGALKQAFRQPDPVRRHRAPRSRLRSRLLRLILQVILGATIGASLAGLAWFFSR